MAVRFLPVDGAKPEEPRDEREDLAEVIDLRSRLRRPAAAAHAGENTADETPELRRSTAAGIIDAVQTAGATRPRPTAAAQGAAEGVAAEQELPSVRRGSRQARASGQDAEQHAVRLLARKAMSSGELRRALEQAEFAADEVEVVIAECEASLYLDDAALAETVTEKLRETKGASEAAIRRKLRERLLPDAAIEAALASLDADEEHALLEHTAMDRARKLRDLDPQTAERRLLGFLARRGWSGEPATRAARAALRETSGSASGVRFR